MNRNDLHERATAVAKHTAATLALLALPALAFVTSWVLAGPVDTIIYSVLFLATFAALPTLIGLLGREVPWNGLFGRIEWILGQLAFNIGILVQRRTSWQMCPGRERDGQYEVYIDGHWYGPINGEENLAIVGFKRFGILLAKDDETLAEYRVEDAVHSDRELDALDSTGVDPIVSDGSGTVTRGGFRQAAVEENDGIGDNMWLLDMKRYYTGGLPQIGDTELLEKAEEVAKREEIDSSTVSRHATTIGGIVGLVLGIATGFAYVYAF